MIYNTASHRNFRRTGGLLLLCAMSFTSMTFAQERDRVRDCDLDRDSNRFTIVERGTVIPVRTDEAIDVERSDYRIYKGIVDKDVRGDDGRLAIPRGSEVELIIRTNSPNDLIIDLESVVANGQRYAIKTDAKRIESQPDEPGGRYCWSDYWRPRPRPCG